MSERYFVTGATGLVGAAITERLVSDGHEVAAYVRDKEKAEKLFSHLGNLSIIVGTLEQPIEYEHSVDYIVHAAAPTDSKFFVERPVETIDAIVQGTKSILELAKEKQVKSVVNLSSMEVYGAPTNEEDLTEDKQFYLNPLNVRSDYPVAKRLAESMCVAYHSEYDVPVKIARLAQVLGDKLIDGDNRVIAQFIRAAKEGVDIKIATDGETKQTYVGIDDTVEAILTILHKGQNGEAYNVSNEETYSSIRGMAELIARVVAGDSIDVIVNTGTNNDKYPPNRTLLVNSDKLISLGWSPEEPLDSCIKALAKN